MLCLYSSLKRCVDIINSLDASKFPLLLNRITQAMQASPTNEKAFSNEEEEKLQLSLGLEKQDLQLLLESTTFIIEQAAYYMTKPSVLQRHLSETLKLNEDKCEAFINIWMSSAKGIVEHLRQRSLFPTQFEGISWSLNLQTATGAQTKQIIPKAVFQFGLKIDESKEISHENVTVEFTHEELFEFYKQLETIQSQLDGLH
ncbi:COMM domain-containing protein 10 isoform X2 [Periplaneta americana]|uniref:COMM domain-containing protein 10 isoform X2 n=1 Tax=Periplaneta americana TaxID=6978 RepID=UPI0037E9B64B